jgi:hypothetical protein
VSYVREIVEFAIGTRADFETRRAAFCWRDAWLGVGAEDGRLDMVLVALENFL